MRAGLYSAIASGGPERRGSISHQLRFASTWARRERQVKRHGSGLRFFLLRFLNNLVCNFLLIYEEGGALIYVFAEWVFVRRFCCFLGRADRHCLCDEVRSN